MAHCEQPDFFSLRMDGVDNPKPLYAVFPEAFKLSDEGFP